MGATDLDEMRGHPTKSQFREFSEMRDLFKTVLTGSMVAGAALLVAACGGSTDNTTNNTANITADDSVVGNTGDMMPADATGNAAGANLGPAATTGNTSVTTTTTTNTTGTGNTTTGAGTGNTTGL
jgi:hypothetical protein